MLSLNSLFCLQLMHCFLFTDTSKLNSDSPNQSLNYISCRSIKKLIFFNFNFSQIYK